MMRRRWQASTCFATPPAPLPIPVRAPSPQHSFGRFLVADSNAAAVAAARTMVEDASPNPLFVHGPSGVGKTTITRQIQARTPRAMLSVSLTTRPRTAHEIEGVDYQFVTETIPAERSFGPLTEGGCPFIKL